MLVSFKKPKKRAFTLVEVLIWFSIIVMIGAVSYTGLARSLNRIYFQKEVEIIKSTTQFAQKIAKVSRGSVFLLIENKGATLFLWLNGESIATKSLESFLNKKKELKTIKEIKLDDSLAQFPLTLECNPDGSWGQKGETKTITALEIIPQSQQAKPEQISLEQPSKTNEQYPQL